MSNVEITIQERVGLLTLTEVLPGGLIVGKCACSYPVVLPQKQWGSIYGCAKCNEEETDRREKEARDRAREEAIEAKAQAEAKVKRDMFWEPHYEELTPFQKKLFKSLLAHGSFDIETITKMTKCSRAEAWSTLAKLMEANCILERNPYGGFRPYQIGRAYELDASESSDFGLRRVAVEQMQSLEPSVKVQVPVKVKMETRVPVDNSEQNIAQVNLFIEDRCLAEQKASVSEVLLRSAFVDHCATHLENDLSPEDFLSALVSIGYRRDKGKVRGLRLRAPHEADPIRQSIPE